jgi:hypothetical protein
MGGRALVSFRSQGSKSLLLPPRLPRNGYCSEVSRSLANALAWSTFSVVAFRVDHTRFLPWRRTEVKLASLSELSASPTEESGSSRSSIEGPCL